MGAMGLMCCRQLRGEVRTVNGELRTGNPSPRSNKCYGSRNKESVPRDNWQSVTGQLNVGFP
jgi:hypothetical protein